MTMTMKHLVYDNDNDNDNETLSKSMTMRNLVYNILPPTQDCFMY